MTSGRPPPGWVVPPTRKSPRAARHHVRRSPQGAQPSVRGRAVDRPAGGAGLALEVGRRAPAPAPRSGRGRRGRARRGGRGPPPRIGRPSASQSTPPRPCTGALTSTNQFSFPGGGLAGARDRRGADVQRRIAHRPPRREDVVELGAVVPGEEDRVVRQAGRAAAQAEHQREPGEGPLAVPGPADGPRPASSRAAGRVRQRRRERGGVPVPDHHVAGDALACRGPHAGHPARRPARSPPPRRRCAALRRSPAAGARAPRRSPYSPPRTCQAPKACSTYPASARAAGARRGSAPA